MRMLVQMAGVAAFQDRAHSVDVVVRRTLVRKRIRLCSAFLVAMCNAVLLGTTVAAPPAQARSVTYSLDIPSQNLNEALQAFALASYHKLLYSSELVDGKISPAIKGEFTPEEALKRLLSGTNLSHEVTSDELVLIRSREAAPYNKTSTSSRPEGRMRMPLSDNQQQEEGEKEGFWQRLRLALAQAGQENTSSDSSGNQQASEDKRVTLGEVIVTAQKREERSIDVPISIVALSADELEQRKLISLNDLQFAVPGMSIFDFGLGRHIQVRGIANLFGLSALVGVYLDEVAVTTGTSTVLNPSTYDLERVEVLRGPQGTLYGEGSAGGTVRFITKSPVLDRFGMTADAAALFTEEGEPGQRVNAAINVPLIENELGLRIAGTFDREGGWIDQPAADRKDINGQDLTNVRVKALWEPNPKFTVNAMAQIYRNDRSSGIGEDANGNYTQVFNLTTTPRVVQEHEIYNLTLTYDFPAVRVLSTTSYIEATNENEHFGNIAPIFPPPAAPFNFNTPNWLLNDRIWVQELRLTSSGSSPWQWTAGVFYRHRRFSEDTPVFYSAQPGPPGTPLPTPLALKSTNLFESWAAFGDLSYRLADRLTLGAGVRYFEDDQENAFGFGFGAPAVLGPEQTASFDSVDPRFYARYSLTEEINVYTSAAKGFRSGGFNAADLPRFDPESVWTYELGTKMSLFERRLRADMAVFYSDYGDYVVLGIDPEPPNFNVFSNAGDARIIGIEWDLEWQPADQWTLGFNGDYLDTEFTEINATSTAVIEGDPLNFVPEYQFTVSAQRDFKWIGRPGLMRLDYSQQGPITTRNRSIGPHWFSESDVINLLDFDMSLQWTENLSLNLFAQNLLNDRGFMSGDRIERNAVRPRPRTYGIGFNFTF